MLRSRTKHRSAIFRFYPHYRPGCLRPWSPLGSFAMPSIMPAAMLLTSSWRDRPSMVFPLESQELEPALFTGINLPASAPTHNALDTSLACCLLPLLHDLRREGLIDGHSYCRDSKVKEILHVIRDVPYGWTYCCEATQKKTCFLPTYSTAPLHEHVETEYRSTLNTSQCAGGSKYC